MIKPIDYNMQNVFMLNNIEKDCFGRDAWSISNIRGEFENDFSHFFGYYDGDKIVGYVCVRTLYEEAQICNIAVLTDYRRQGIATKLLQTIACFSAKKGCIRSELEVNTLNQPAVELYKKAGYTVAGIRKNFYRRTRFASGDAYTMIKDLNV